MIVPRSNEIDEMWLGYSGLSVACAGVTAVVQYEAAWDRRIVQCYGSLPAGVCSVVLLEDGQVFPARRPLEDLRRQLHTWQTRRVS